jgi:peptidoglycan-N-acetylglucosamine deacetylase
MLRLFALMISLLIGGLRAQTMVALSFDDPSTLPSPKGPWQERNQKILQTLANHELKAALFVCGMRVHSPAGQALLKSWDQAGHAIANHSYTHPFFSGSKESAVNFERELLRTDSMIRGYAHFRPWFRFPFLKEGKTVERRDSMRTLLAVHGYRNGHVSIDASDWYVDQMLSDSLKKNPQLNPLPYKEFYVAHILDRAHYYDSLATAIAGHKVRLVLLLHHNLINAMFLDDVIRALVADGWVFIDPEYAYQDPIYLQSPDALPAGESFFWSLAKATGRYESVLRYPAEDGDYEQAGLQRMLLGRK